MTKSILIIHLFIAMMTFCNAQTRLDITSISFDNPSIELKETPKSNDGVFIPRPISSYDNVEAFGFGDFKPTNGGEAVEVDFSSYISRIEFYFDKQKEKTIATQITVKKDKESYAFFEYLMERYGEPLTLKEEPTCKVDGVLMESASYLWKNVAENRSVIATKTYSIEQGRCVYGLKVYYLKTEDSELAFIHPDIGVNDLTKFK